MSLHRKEVAAFLSIARLGSVGAASADLAVTQPALSRTLKKLESQLGVPLFLRRASGMELTPFGHALLPHAEMLESEAMRAVEELALLKGASRGVARIGIVPSVAVDLLPGAIEGALRRSPGIQVQVLEATGTQLMAALTRGEIDFAVAGIRGEPADDGLRVEPLTEDDACMVARAGHPVAAAEQPTIGDLAACGWAMPERGNVIWAQFRTMFRREGLDTPPVAVSANSVHTLKSLILATDLVTMLAQVSFELERTHGLLVAVRFAGGRWRRPLGIVRRATGSLLPAAGLLLAELRQVAARRNAGG